MHPTLVLPAGFQLAATVLLAIVPVISATPSPVQLSPGRVEFRDLKPPTFDHGWVGIGCYTDDPDQPALTSVFKSDPEMSAGLCVNICSGQFTNMAGVENGQDCRCGNVTTAGATSVSPELCNLECPGHSDQNCGGTNTLAIYGNDQRKKVPAAIVQNVGPWKFFGCHHDDDIARTLTELKSGPGGEFNNTVENCINACRAAGYYYAGMEAAKYCWCDNQINQGRMPIDSSSYCVLPCPGDNREICGGAHSLVIYQLPKPE